jgi:hypothetical protein
MVNVNGIAISHNQASQGIPYFGHLQNRPSTFTLQGMQGMQGMRNLSMS